MMAPHAVAENPHEALNRERKARKLAAVLQAAQCDSETARYINQSAWLDAAAKAGVNPPSARTRAIAISILEDYEALDQQIDQEIDAEDAFRGLP